MIEFEQVRKLQTFAQDQLRIERYLISFNQVSNQPDAIHQERLKRSVITTEHLCNKVDTRTQIPPHQGFE